MDFQPNKLLLKIFSQLNPSGHFLDLGCGMGHDSMFMVKNGFKVEAVDKSEEKIKNLDNLISDDSANKNNIQLFNQNIIDFKIESNKFEVINAFNSLQFLKKSDALATIENIKDGLTDGGYFVFCGFTILDPIFKMPQSLGRAFWELDEVKNIFSTFKIILYEEKEVDDPPHQGYPESHKHGVVRMIAQKVV